MVFAGIEEKSSFSIANGYEGTTKSYEIDVQPNAGISHIMLEVGVVPVGSGTLTLVPMAPFGIISSLKVSDQNGIQLGNYTGAELVLFHQALGKNNPFKNVQYKDGTNGWVELAASTDVATTEEIRGTLHLPVRIGKSKNISKLKFEITFSSLNSTTGLKGFGDFATSWTSWTGTIRANPVYDDSIVETWIGHIFSEASVGTSFIVFKDPPRSKKIRYALVYLPDYYVAQNATTDNETLLDAFEFRKDTKVTPIRLNQHTMRYTLQDMLDADPEFVMGDTSATAWNWFILVLPDLEMGENSRFALKNLSSQDAKLILIEVEPDPQKAKESKSLSPAVIGRFFKG